MEATIVAELIYRQYSSGDPSSESGLELKDFEYAVQQARAYKIRYDYFNTSKIEGERTINQGWLKQYKNVAVKLDTDTDTYYSVLPSQVLDLPRNMGLFFVSPMKNFNAPFAQQTIGQAYIFSGNPTDTIVYNYDNENIYYQNFDPAIKQVYMQTIPLTDDNIPDEFTAEISELVLNRYMPNRKIPESKVADNNPNDA